jgi:hypothetical protein
MTSRRRWATALAGLAAAVAGSSCGLLSNPLPDAVVVSQNSIDAGALGLVPAGELENFPVTSLCVEHRASARIIRVHPLSVRGGLTVNDFSVVPFRNGMPGSSRGPLAKTRDYRGGTTVTTACSHNRDATGALLIVEYRKPTVVVASSDALVVTYRSGSKDWHVIVHFAMSLCATRECHLRATG